MDQKRGERLTLAGLGLVAEKGLQEAVADLIVGEVVCGISLIEDTLRGQSLDELLTTLWIRDLVVVEDEADHEVVAIQDLERRMEES